MNYRQAFRQGPGVADIAGFYNAFGVKPSDEFLDHVVCELEFMSLLCLREAYAVAQGAYEQADVCSRAERKFLTEQAPEVVNPKRSL